MEHIPQLLTVAVLLASLALWGVILERLSTGEPLFPCRIPVTRPRPATAVTIVGIWVVYVVYLIISLQLAGHERKLPDTNLRDALRITGGNILEQCIVASIMVMTLSGLGVRSLNRYGIDGRRIPEKLNWGLKGYVASVIPVVLVSLLMQRFHNPDNKHPFLQLLDQQQSVSLVTLLLISTVVMAPISEELMYRVILQGAFQRWMPPWAAIAGSSVLFSAVHGFPDAVSLLPLAGILGFLYWRTGSYLVVVTTHASFNGFNILMALLGGGE
jgi:membrane protease YdiL (CAAX protease family)